VGVNFVAEQFVETLAALIALPTFIARARIDRASIGARVRICSIQSNVRRLLCLCSRTYSPLQLRKVSGIDLCGSYSVFLGVREEFEFRPLRRAEVGRLPKHWILVQHTPRRCPF
jgi:hypothetical protein